MSTLDSPSVRGLRSRCLPALLAAGVLALLTASTASAKDDRPGVGGNPAFVCLHTTITDKGHTRQTRIIRHSGNRQADNGTLRLIRKTKFINDIGVEREVHILVRKHGTGFAMRVYELHETVPDICSEPPPERRSKKQGNKEDGGG